MQIENVDLSKYVQLKDFIRRSGYNAATVHRWLQDGVIDSIKIVDARLIPLTELERVQATGSPKRGRGNWGPRK